MGRPARPLHDASVMGSSASTTNGQEVSVPQLVAAGFDVGAAGPRISEQCPPRTPPDDFCEQRGSKRRICASCLMSTPASCFRSWSARGRHHDVGEIGSRAPIWKTRSDQNVRRPRHVRRRREPRPGGTSSRRFHRTENRSLLAWWCIYLLKLRRCYLREPFESRHHPSTCGAGSPRSDARLRPWRVFALVALRPAFPKPLASKVSRDASARSPR